MSAQDKKAVAGECDLCGGTGEVQITPYGQPDSHSDVFGCPACIQADRDEAERQRDQLLAALKSAKHMLERDYIDDAKMAVIEKCDAAIEAVEGGA